MDGDAGTTWRGARFDNRNRDVHDMKSNPFVIIVSYSTVIINTSITLKCQVNSRIGRLRVTAEREILPPRHRTTHMLITFGINEVGPSHHHVMTYESLTFWKH